MISEAPNETLPTAQKLAAGRILSGLALLGALTFAVSLGVSPRGTMALYHTAQARAAIRGREYVIPDDVKALAPHVLTHRIIINPQTRLRGRTPEEVVMDVVEQVPVPVEIL